MVGIPILYVWTVVCMHLFPHLQGPANWTRPSEDGAKKRRAKNRKYYEKHKARILANRKQKYKENAVVEKAASRLQYDANLETQKRAARTWSKAKYRANLVTQKRAACA